MEVTQQVPTLGDANPIDTSDWPPPLLPLLFPGFRKGEGNRGEAESDELEYLPQMWMHHSSLLYACTLFSLFLFESRKQEEEEW